MVKILILFKTPQYFNSIERWCIFADRVVRISQTSYRVNEGANEFKISASVISRFETRDVPGMASEVITYDNGITASGLITIACETLYVSLDSMKSDSRSREVVDARHIIQALLYMTFPDMTLKEIGRVFNRHHSSVIHAIKKYNTLYESDQPFTKKVNKVKNQL